MTPSPLGPKLPAEVLATRHRLPVKPEAVELRVPGVLVRPYSAQDAEELHTGSCGAPVARLGRSVGAYDPEERVWRFMPAGPFEAPAQLHAFHDYVDELPNSRVFTVQDGGTSELLGSASLLTNEPMHLKIEIGGVWYMPPVQGTGINGEVTRLLLAHAFSVGYQRVEWKCHVGNLRSRAAAERLGFVFEGVQEAHYIVKGRRRDTAWYRILASEWPPPGQ